MRRRKRGAGLGPFGGCILIIAGLIILSGVYVAHLMQQDFARISVTTTGTVTELVRGSGKSKSYFPIVQFLTPREHVYSFKSANGTNPASYQVGDKVDVLYNPEAPEQAVIAADNSIASNRTMWIFAGVGVLLVLVGLWPFAKLLRWLRERAWSRPSPDAVSAL
jgi:hypothetical protein